MKFYGLLVEKVKKNPPNVSFQNAIGLSLAWVCLASIIIGPSPRGVRTSTFFEGKFVRLLGPRGHLVSWNHTIYYMYYGFPNMIQAHVAI